MTLVTHPTPQQVRDWMRAPARKEGPYGRLGFLPLLLAGCATPQATVQVKVPVYVPCAKAVPRPAFALPVLPADASDWEKVLAMARDMLLHFKYEGLMEAVIAGCL